MIDPTVRQLLEEVIDTPIKLQLLLLFYESPRLELNAKQAANRTYRDIWSMREALHELHLDGILSVNGATDDPSYIYTPLPEHLDRINRLAYSFNEPIERDHVHHTLRELSSNAGYRRARQQIRGGFELQMI